MRYLYAVLLLSLACSSPEQRPSTLNQSAFRTPPRPPVFTPIDDAPHTVGQPGHIQPQRQVEPGPKPKRLLPHTAQTAREPTIWATSDPDAVVPELLGTRPLDEIGAATARDYVRDARSCASMMERAIDMADERKRTDALTRKQQMCLAAKLYVACLDEATARGIAHPPHIVSMAGAYRDKLCKQSSAIAAHLDAIARNATSEYRKRVEEMNMKAKKLR